jgi:deoxyribodipyrimidine photo-lyase
LPLKQGERSVAADVLITDGKEAPRVLLLADRPVTRDDRYVPCWLQQALPARDDPVLDAAFYLGDALYLPVLVYHDLREDYPNASDRLLRFILGAGVDLALGCPS